MRLYSEIELNEQLDRLHLSPKQKGNIRGLISIITEKYSDQIEKMKCCQNCKYDENKISEEPCCNCIKCIFSDSEINKWEFAE